MRKARAARAGKESEGLLKTVGGFPWAVHVTPTPHPRPARGPSGGVCVHISGGGHVSEDMCPFLEAERGFPTQTGEKAGALGRATGEAGGGDHCPEPLVPWRGCGGKMRGQAGLNVRNGAWEQSRGGSRRKRSLMPPDAGRCAQAQRGAQRAEPKAVQRGVRGVPREALEHISKAGFQVPWAEAGVWTGHWSPTSSKSPRRLMPSH